MERKTLETLVAQLAKEVTVLIAEDSFVIRKILVRLLKKWGFQVIEAQDGKEAWEKFNKAHEKISIVILDWIMPEMDGLEVCRLIRQIDVGHYVYIIFLSAIEKKENIAKCLESGADDYIVKPIHEKEFLARITVGLRIVGLERALQEANRKLKKMATTDELTGLLNRRALFDELKRDAYRSLREKRPLHIIMLDIDHFKKVNDNYGHQVGDAVLQELARRLKAELRPYDIVGRYGGEEFLIAFINGELNDALTVAERLRFRVCQKPFVISEKISLPVTISLGVADFEPNINTDNEKEIMAHLNEAIRMADEALYEAKRLGRNRVVTYSEPRLEEEKIVQEY